MMQRAMGRALLPAILTVSMLPVAAGAQGDRVRIPEDTVVRVRLDDAVNGRSAREGQRVMASLDRDDRSGFPLGTRFEGTITELRRAGNGRPGTMDMEFRRAMLPDRDWINLDGRLARLSGDEIRRVDGGRLEARRGGSRIDTRWIGYGAAGGAVLGVLLGGGSGDLLKGALLGALGGAAYGYINRDRDRDYRDYQDVSLNRGTDFGIRLDRPVSFQDRSDFRYTGDFGRNRGRDRYEDRYDDRYDDRGRDRSRSRGDFDGDTA
ncbi:MAG: hypothetical protein FJX77_11135 [Armatimonadetes bacterium]|nr:hypothetical protein [Armatimonadota bacterium]